MTLEAVTCHLALPLLAPRLMALGHGGGAAALGAGARGAQAEPMVLSNVAEVEPAAPVLGREGGGSADGGVGSLEDDSWADGLSRPAPSAAPPAAGPGAAAVAALVNAIAAAGLMRREFAAQMAEERFGREELARLLAESRAAAAGAPAAARGAPGGAGGGR